jgi:hypothetical protein
MNFTRILSLPFLILIIVAGYRIFVLDLIYDSIFIAISVVSLTVLYVFEPQINWWWWKFFPPALDEKLYQILLKVWPAMDHFIPEVNKIARQRIQLYSMGQDFTLMGSGKVPLDIKCILATIPVRMTLTLSGNKFLMKPYERIILYNGLFPSPAYKIPHSCEVHHEDGVLIFSMKHLLDGMANSESHFSTGFYCFAQAYLRLYATRPWPSLNPEHDWSVLEKISGLYINKIKAEHKLPELDILAFAITCYFTRGEQMKSLAPDWYESFESVFKELSLS